MHTIGILETGITPEPLIAEHGSYSAMLMHLLSCARDKKHFQFRKYCVMDNHLPDTANECNGWMVTGSASSVYEDLPWIPRLKTLIQEIHKEKIPLTGICFGHQVIAAALGGEVKKSEKGWGIGIHKYNLCSHPDWLTVDSDEMLLNAMHQDQVVTTPPGAQVIASSEFCPNAGLLYGETVFTLQGHPEFTKAYEKALIELRETISIPAEIAAPAIQELEKPDSKTHSQEIADALCKFFNQHMKSDQ